ncbi:MAG: hypothetical protein B6242_08715 [Anaerolineaceae bacterium 4572_78]|nr:MAG: hypothetical protein B6242_08715 [Anaerolineaceae bacterium 4572_78]
MLPEKNWTVYFSDTVFNSRDILILLMVSLIFIISSVVILKARFSVVDSLENLEVGDVSSQDVIALSFVSYESEIATEEEKERVANAIPQVYNRPDPKVLHQQQELANQVFNFLDAVRADPYATVEKKLIFVGSIQPVSFSQEESANTINLHDNAWLSVKQEVRAVLNASMRSEIRETQLTNVRRQLDLYISADASDLQRTIILAIAEDLIQPNTFIDETVTNERRQQAMDSVEPVVMAFEKNEIIVRAGEKVTAKNIEALQALGYQTPESTNREIAATFVWIAFLIGLLNYYLIKYHLDIIRERRKLMLLIGLMLVFVLAIRLMVDGNQTIFAYVLPTAALTIMVAAFLDPQLALIVTILIGFIQAQIAGNSYEFLAYIILSGLIVASTIQRLAYLTNLLWAGLYVAASNTVIILIFTLFENNINFEVLGAQLGAGILNGFLSTAIALIGFFIVGNTTGIITYIQLLELSRPNHPLLKEMIRRAPGTYHHTLMVSNLAEQAAQQIGTHGFLCRVGAYYHDVGKMMRPFFFTENTRPGMTSLHKDLAPETSAEIIISHVTDGLKLAKKYRLPPTIQAFISEHHGTEVTLFFYNQTVNAMGGDESLVDKSKFTYPGPPPQTKETAIVMLADACEATVRAVQPQTAEEIDQIIRKTIETRQKSGQFNECGLTMRDFELIRLAFNDFLKGVSHPRIKYPKRIQKDKVINAKTSIQAHKSD